MMRKLILKTERLILSELNLEDAGFILELFNEPAFLQYIGDRNIRNLEDAKAYLNSNLLASYAKIGSGLWLVQLNSSQESIGICGLVKRDCLPDLDIGYAFLENYWSKGYATEAALAVMEYGQQVFGLERMVAITDLQNYGSIRVLEKIGMKFEQLIKLTADGPELNLFAINPGFTG
jgi:RimJ/RimL family protein N-acetyltransferase